MNVINTFHLKPLNLPSQTSKPLTPSSIIDAMTQAVQQFVGDTEQSDDLTMLAIQYSRQKSDIIIQRSLTLQNDIQEVPQLAEFVDELCEAIGIDMATSMQLNLAIEEAVVNVMNYAYPKDEQGEVRILAEANNKRIKFIISDDGKPFDPTAHGEVDTTLTADERDIGGLGIHLVRKIMDSINYERTQNQNVFTLRKNLKQERETTEQ
jgi:sigma-B regulation protein RsbU (phosphoserine phosphatase)